MALSLVAHATDTPERMRCWIGVTGSVVEPVLQWTLDGASVVPALKRPLQKVLDGDLGAKASGTVWTGCYEIEVAGPVPQAGYEIGVSTGNSRVLRRMRPLPASIPYGDKAISGVYTNLDHLVPLPSEKPEDKPDAPFAGTVAAGAPRAARKASSKQAKKPRTRSARKPPKEASGDD